MDAQILPADAEHLPLADRSVDLVFGSPPYCDARTYGIGAQRGCLEWVAWMLRCTVEAQRVCRGPVLWVAAGVTRTRSYWPACEGLMWEWWRRGGDCQLYRPCIYHRVGIPGSGGKDWFRADTEYVMCFKRLGRLPWSDNTAMGHPPKWGPGGAMSHRLSDGTRVTQWGRPGSGRGRHANGQRKPSGSPSHKLTVTRPRAGQHAQTTPYAPPTLANPGNVVSLPVGGGHMGSKLAHENEAPFPEALARYFVLPLCPPGGTVLDPFAGSGTTGAVALANGRNAILVDIRESQCELMKRRLGAVQLTFDAAGGVSCQPS